MAKLTIKKFKEILQHARLNGRTLAESASAHNTNAFALMNFIAESEEAKSEFEKYKSEKENTEGFTKIFFREITYERLHGIITGYYVEEKVVKEDYAYVYPENDYQNTPIKVKTKESVVSKSRYIPPNAEILAKIISSIGFMKGEKEIAAGTIKAIIETIKAYQSNKISQDSFVAIIRSMPISEEEQAKIIADTIDSSNSDNPTFEIRANDLSHIGWGAKIIDEQIEEKSKDFEQ